MRKMNLIIISLALIGAITVVFSIVYTLVNVHTSALWVRILALILMLGGYVGIVALIMLLLRMPLA